MAGLRRVALHWWRTASGMNEWRTCLTCHGKGTVNGKTCGGCGGSGGASISPETL